MSKKRTIISPYNFKLKKEHKEKTIGETMTVQGESYTILELLQKHTQGIDTNIERQTHYDDDADFDSMDKSKLQSMDLVDIDELKENVKITVNSKTKKLKKMEQEKLDKQLEEKLKQQLLAEKKQQQTTTTTKQTQKTNEPQIE